jgi:Kef-type K+ transport system membrane component KefB
MAIAIDIIIILLFSVLGGVLATRLKQPSVLGVLLAGALVGPHALGLLTDTELMNLAIELGAILLLFLVGIEFSLSKLLDLGLRSVIIAAIKIGLIFFFGYHIALFFGLKPITGMAIGIILSVTSTVIFLKILEQKGLSSRPEVPLLIAVLIIEDIFGVFALTFFSGLASQTEITTLVIILRLVMALALLGSVYLLIIKVLRPILNWLSAYSAQDTITFMAICLCAVMSFLAHELGLSTAVGAFLAGNIVSSLRNAEAFEHAMHPFILTFTSLFFFSIGTIVNFGEIFDHFWLVAALFAINIVMKFATIGVSTYLFSIPSGKSAVFSGLAMLSLGEFSLLIAQQANKLSPAVDLVSITAIIIFLSSLAMSLLVGHSQMVHKIISSIMPRGIKYDLVEGSRYCRTLSSETLLNRLTNRSITIHWHHIVNNLIGLFIVTAVVLTIYYAPQFQNVEDTISGSYFPFVFISVAFLMLFPTFRLLRNTRDVLLDISKSLLKMYPHEVANHEKILRNIIFVVLLFLLSFLIPTIISVFGLHPVWAVALIPFIVLLDIIIMKLVQFSVSIASNRGKLGIIYREQKDSVRRKMLMAKLKVQSYKHQREMRRMLK